MDEFLLSLNETEGPAAVSAFVAAHGGQMESVDSVRAIYLRGYAAAVSGNEAEARAFAARLAAADPERILNVRLAAALGDRETVLEDLESIPEEEYDIGLRFNLEHDPFLRFLHEDPRFQAILDKLPPYADRAEQR